MRTTDKSGRTTAGRWLRLRREQAGVTQREIARAIGVEYITYISQIEAGRGRVPPSRYEEYARVLNMTPQEFVRELLKHYDPEAHKILFGTERSGTNAKP